MTKVIVGDRLQGLVYKKQCVFYKKEEHWKVDQLKLKNKKKESKPEANIAQVKIRR